MKLNVNHYVILGLILTVQYLVIVLSYSICCNVSYKFRSPAKVYKL